MSDAMGDAKVLKKYGLDITDVLRDTHAATMLRIGSLLDGFFKLALEKRAFNDGKPLKDAMFRGNGKFSKLYGKIEEANDLKLIDKVTYEDATLLRKIRNEFGHGKSKLHFDSPQIVEFVKRLSTYDGAEFNQDAILAACTKVVDYLSASQ